MSFSVKILEYKDINAFKHLFEKSFPELKKEIEKYGLDSPKMNNKYFYDNFIYPCMFNELVIILCNNDDIIGYEFMYLSPENTSLVTLAYTYILPEFRGNKLSHILREKMYQSIRNKNIKKIYFTVTVDNKISNNNMLKYKDKFKITEVATTYLLEL